MSEFVYLMKNDDLYKIGCTTNLESEAIKMANDTNYGLAAIIWTQDNNRADKLAEVLESGLVWINCWLERDLRTPFGGIKNSGLGKEGGKYALNFRLYLFPQQKLLHPQWCR